MLINSICDTVDYEQALFSCPHDGGRIPRGDIMAEKTLGEQLMDSLTRYTTDKEKEIHKAALSIQKEMLGEVISRSPVQDYDHNGGVRRRLMVRRSKNSPAKWGSWGEKFAPGKFRAGWVKSTMTPKAKSQKIYAVRNKAAPMLTHLVNFKHDHFAHGKFTGEINGNQQNPEFVTDVQNKGIENFGNEIEKM